MASLVSSAVFPSAVAAPVLPARRRIGANGAGSAAFLRSPVSSPLSNAFQGTPVNRATIHANKQQAVRAAGSAAVMAAASKGTSKGTVVVEPDPRIPIVLLGVSGALFAVDNKLAAAPIGLLGALLAFQTTRVRFVFTEEALEVRIGQQLESSGENVFVGGENKWKYDTFVNWEFWWPAFPVLVYFKETQTRPEGQVHFFPIIANGKQLYDVMVERCGPSKGSGPSA
ncbi:hypothetical protein CLOP_g14143 [Closterium sp. NIES-67]|nr:hypothetical protein CLOP_g10700 [Closterium sp. NIES-67]GJP84051.1 hypothetical protein CLOP_g14143 [Closterium sp. NIES-67]